MSWESAGRRAGRLAAVAVMSVVTGATAGSAFGQASPGGQAHHGGQAMTMGPAAARMQKIEDRQAIEQLLMGDYPRALDSNDWVAYGALFAKDGVLVMQGGATNRVGPAAITDFFTHSRIGAPPPASATPSPCPLPAGVHRFMHVVTNLTLQINGDTATDQAYWETIGTTDCKSVVEGAGHYEDVLKREDGKWKFFKRAIFDDLPPKTVPATAPAAPKP
ncbi:MAG TPA: nuclear transport factor 2 family protein [Candidatus Acidoferrales bacterium]|nr:nuclear transport factor 2 family protein [Candidatus Acidoferrales bacterium]